MHACLGKGAQTVIYQAAKIITREARWRKLPHCDLKKWLKHDLSKYIIVLLQKDICV